MNKHLLLPARLAAGWGLAVVLTEVGPGVAQAAGTHHCHFDQRQLPRTADAVTGWYAACASRPVAGPWH